MAIFLDFGEKTLHALPCSVPRLGSILTALLLLAVNFLVALKLCAQ